MTLADVKTMLETIEAFQNKVAYRAFSQGSVPALPYICYLATTTDNFTADNQVFLVRQEVDIELYSHYKDQTSEGLIENKLNEYNIIWDKYDEYIEDEDVYEVVYTITI